MGKTYREAIEAVMRQYGDAWSRAMDEFDRYGEVGSTTDRYLTSLEEELAILEMTW